MKIVTEYLIYLVYWVINSLIIYLGSLVFKGNIVLIGIRYPIFFSAIASGFVVTLLVVLTLLYIERRGTKITELVNYLLFFLVADTISVWITARFSDYFGFGIKNYRYAIILAIAMVIVQRLAFQYYKKMEPKG